MADATDPQMRPGALVPADDVLVDQIEALLDGGDMGALLAFLDDLYPADIARLMASLGEDDRQRLFDGLPTEMASEVLIELDDDEREGVLEETSNERVTDILNELDTDDAADVFESLGDDVARQILPQLDDADEIRELLLYAGDTAGGIMAAEYVAVADRVTVDEATEEVRRQAEDVEDVYTVFVLDRDDRLVGLLSLKSLLLAPARRPVREIMETDFVSVEVDVDQEIVARMMGRYDLVSLPVVDKAGRLVGLITIDDIVDVLREEAEEDFQVISGSGDEGLHDSPLVVSRRRLPWLIVGLVGTIMSASVVLTFGGAVEKVAVLAALMPIVTAMAGNAAIQSASITVQGLSSGRLLVSDALGRVGKEFVVALVNGALLSVLVGIAVMALGMLKIGTFDLPFREVVRVAEVAMIALASVILLATVNGAVIPVVLARMGIDPALSMGPFVTTANDILGLSVFFTVATLLLL